MDKNSYFIMTKNKEEAENLKKKGYQLISENYGVFCFLDKETENYESAVKDSETIRTRMLYM